MDNTSKSDAHRKRLAQILRYIASMHQTMSNGADEKCSFVKDFPAPQDFFQEPSDDRDDKNGVLFSTSDFQRLLAVQGTGEKLLFPSPPFSFYAANGSPTARKRTFSGALKSTFSFSHDKYPDKACWLRITRLTNAQVSTRPEIPSNPALQTYLDDWKKRLRVGSWDALFTVENMLKAPKVPPTLASRDATVIKGFMDRYLVYAQKKRYQTSLEPTMPSLNGSSSTRITTRSLYGDWAMRKQSKKGTTFPVRSWKSWWK